MLRTALRAGLYQRKVILQPLCRLQAQQLHVLINRSDVNTRTSMLGESNVQGIGAQLQFTRSMAKKSKGGKGGKAPKAVVAEDEEEIQKEIDWEKIEKSMRVSVNYITTNLEHIRAGAASAAMFDSVMVESHGSKVPLSAIGQVAVRDPKTVMISCYDPSSAPHVVSAILEADMGLNPDIADEGMIKVPIPKTTKETRQTLIKKCKEIAERAKVNLRGARGKGMDQVKHANLPKDEARAAEKRVQKEHDSIHKELDAIAHKKIDSLA